MSRLWLPCQQTKKERYHQMNLVYICHPFDGTPEEIRANIRSARRYARYVAGINGWFPVCTHTMWERVISAKSNKTRDEIMSSCLHILTKCNLIAVCGVRVTDGMNMEIFKAYTNNLCRVNLEHPHKTKNVFIRDV